MIPVDLSLFSGVLVYLYITHIIPHSLWLTPLIPHQVYDFIYLLIYFKVSGSVEAGRAQKDLKASVSGFLNK